MLCPFCFEDNHNVTLTATSTDAIYRRRHCKVCGKMWETVEMDVDRAPEDYRSGDGYENNAKKLNELLHLRKPRDLR
ncbi:MAG: hypothetical protein J6S14_11370 [Clostridia bacterium]|nr:hypothetical protein [Clostridia bacterium]